MLSSYSHEGEDRGVLSGDVRPVCTSASQGKACGPEEELDGGTTEWQD